MSRRNWFLFFFVGFIWGIPYLLIKVAVEDLLPPVIVFARVAIGAAILIRIAMKRGSLLPAIKAWRYVIPYAIGEMIGPWFLITAAEQKMTSGLAGLLVATVPIWTTILASIHGDKTVWHHKRLLRILIGFIGVLTVLGAWKGLGDNPLWAILILLAAVTCYGFSFPYSRRFILPQKLQPESIAAGQVTMGALTLLPFFIYNGVEKYEYQPAPVLAMVALGVFGSGFAYIWNFKVMAIAGSAIASSVTYLTPVVAVIVGIIFLQESIYWYEPVGAIIVLLGAAIGQNRIKLSAK